MADDATGPSGAADLIPGIGPGGELYPIGKLEAHRAGALHAAVSVFVFAGDRLLLQRRAAGKYHSGGQWANACCTHPHWGEAPADAAARRLREELGVALPLEEIGETEYRADVGGGLVEHERVRLYRGRAEAARLRLDPDPAEVDATRWARRAEIEAEIEKEPGRFAPWLRVYMARWDQLGLAP